MSIASRITSIENHIEEAYTEISRLGVDLTNVDKNIDNIADMLQEAYENTPKVTGEGSSLSLTPTRKGGLTIIPKGACEQDTLPSEYQAVEYIESTNGAYTNISVTITSSSVVRCKFMLNELASDYATIYGTGGATPVAIYCYTTGQAPYQGKVTARFGSFADTTKFPTNGDTEANKIYDTINTYSSLICNGNTYTNTPSGYNNNTSITLFADSNLTHKLKGKIYRFAIDGVIDLVPCYRVSDTKVGFYDLINGTFYSNSGEVNYTKGNNVSIPNPDYPQDIRVVTGDNSVVIQNKNLFDYSKIVSMAIGGNTISVASNYKGFYIPYKKGTTLTLSRDTITSEKNNRFRYCFTYEKPAGSVKAYNSTGGTTYTDLDNSLSGTIFSNLDFKYLFVYLSNNNSTGITENDVKIQLEVGSTATEYVTHAEQSYTLHLGTNYLAGIGDYKDEITGKTNDWKIKRKVGKIVYDGSVDESWGNVSALGDYYRTAIEISGIKSINANIDYQGLSNRFIKDTSVITNKNPFPGAMCQYRNTSTVYFVITQTNVGDFKAWLTSNNVILYYVLETPTEETITDTTLITDLNNMYQAMGYDGTTNITVTSEDTNAQMTASVSALKGE